MGTDSFPSFLISPFNEVVTCRACLSCWHILLAVAVVVTHAIGQSPEVSSTAHVHTLSGLVAGGCTYSWPPSAAVLSLSIGTQEVQHACCIHACMQGWSVQRGPLGLW